MLGGFLERVFSESEPLFVLKGGRSILARTVKARYTRDTDFLYRGVDIEEAVDELKRLASIDLQDFLEFRFVSANEIAKDQEYRDGYRVVFKPVLGGAKQLNDITIDLVVNQVPGGVADVVKPANRLDVEGLPVFDYHVYPVVNAMADKICATMQVHQGGRPSSRVRDLVDLVVYLTTESFKAEEAARNIVAESRLRGMGEISEFHVPASWRENYEKSFAKSAAEADLPDDCRTIEAAERLVQLCVNRALSGAVDGCAWSPDSLEWLSDES